MQTYDLIMLAVLIGAGIFGAVKGFAWQIASLASLIISYFVAYRYRDDVSKYIDAEPPWNAIVAMLLLYVGTSFAIWIGFRLFSGLIDKVRLKEFDRHLGAIFGMLKGAILCLLITMFGMTLLGAQQQAAICQSRSGYFIAQVLQRADGILPHEVGEVVGPYLEKLDQQLRDGGVETDEKGFWEKAIPGAGNSQDGNSFGSNNLEPNSFSENLTGRRTRAGDSSGAPPSAGQWNTTIPWSQARQPDAGNPVQR